MKYNPPMARERILDIGIGRGGTYINWDSPYTQRIGLDIDFAFLKMLKNVYPDVLPVRANTQRLPFPAGSINTIEIILPCSYLLTPGLQTYHPNISVDNHQAQTWYPEFFRALVPHGNLRIFGDMWLHLPSILTGSAPYFRHTRINHLSLDEFRQIGTRTSRDLLDKYSTQFPQDLKTRFEEGLVEIWLLKRT